MGARPPGRLLVAATTTLLILIWGTTWAAIRISLEGFPPFTGVALRFGIGGLALLAMARVQGVPIGREKRERYLWVIQGIFSFSLSYGVVYWAEQWVPSGLASLLFATFPLFVAILAFGTLPGERLGPVALAGLVIGFAGVGVIFSDDLAALGGPQVAFAGLVMLISPASSAVGQVVVKRFGQGIHPLSLTAVPMLVTAAIMTFMAWWLERGSEIRFEAGPVAAVLYLALVGSAVTFSLYFWLLEHLPATRLSLIAYGIPLVAVAVGTLALDEPLTLALLLGGGMVLAGAWLVMRPAKSA